LATKLRPAMVVEASVEASAVVSATKATVDKHLATAVDSAGAVTVEDTAIPLQVPAVTRGGKLPPFDKLDT